MINNLSIALIFGMGFLLLVVPRRMAVLPILVASYFSTLGQVLYVAGFHFSIMRIMVLFGWARIFIKGENRPLSWNAIDKTITIWVVVSVIAYTILWQTTEAFVNRLGFAFNAVGMYFMFRMLICDEKDAYDVIKWLLVICLPMSLLMLVELTTGRNLFAVFGGVPEITIVREGKLRCQGSFAHSILAGTFGAALMPLLLAYWWKENRNIALPVLGVISSTVITFLSSSSGPVFAYMFGLVSLLCWHYRGKLRLIRWGIFLSVISLHQVMKAPVWFLIGRITAFSGSTGWHRANLIDATIRHFDEWWLIGTKNTSHWFGITLSADPTSIDITNQFVFEGVSGGLLKVVLFVFLIAYCYRYIGMAVNRTMEENKSYKMLLWCTGCSLSVHIASFISVSYFDQIIVIWYLLLAMISSLAGDFVLKESRDLESIVRDEDFIIKGSLGA